MPTPDTNTTQPLTELNFPDGYCLDPNGVMIRPHGAEPHWSFGYECGYRDAFETLNCAALAALPLPGWVSIKDQLPKEHEFVLVWNERMGRQISRRDRYGAFTTAGGAPTHWTPIPAAPGQAQTEEINPSAASRGE